MNEKIITITAMLCILTLTGCHQTGHDYYSHELEKIDHRQNRELARKEIVAIKDEIASQSEDIRMYHLLLIAEMNDELTPYRNIDTARRLVDYYEEHGDKQKLLRSYIIAGNIYANCSDGPKALGYFYKAEDMLADSKEPELRNKLNSKIAKLQLRHNMPEAARAHTRKVIDYCRQQRDTIGLIEALIDLSASNQNSHDGGLEYLQTAYDLAVKANHLDLQNETRLALAKTYVESQHYHAAKPLILPLANQFPQTECHKANSLLCQIYYYIGKPDSALYYGEKVMKNGNSVSKRDVHEILAHICIQRGLKTEAEKHLSHYIELNNELNQIANSEAIAQADAFYHNQKKEKENEKLMADNARKHYTIIIGIALLVVLTSLFATYIQRHRRYQELMELRIEHLEQLKRDYAKADAEELRQAIQTIESTPIWQRLATLPESKHPSEEDWQELIKAINQTYRDFTTKLIRLSHPSTHEYHVCLLLKAGFEPVRIAALTLRSKAAISTVRSRLYEKTFGKKGSAKDWDEVIRTL